MQMRDLSCVLKTYDLENIFNSGFRYSEKYLQYQDILQRLRSACRLYERLDAADLVPHVPYLRTLTHGIVLSWLGSNVYRHDVQVNVWFRHNPPTMYEFDFTGTRTYPSQDGEAPIYKSLSHTGHDVELSLPLHLVQVLTSIRAPGAAPDADA